MTNSCNKLAYFFFFSTGILSVEGFKDSSITCSSEDVACVIGNGNELESFGGVSAIGECRQLCWDNHECEFITYYNSNSFPFIEICELFNDCEKICLCVFMAFLIKKVLQKHL